MATLRLSHVGRYATIVRLLVAHRELLTGTPLQADLEAPAEDARALVAELEAMGPTFVKLGQLLASRVDLLPAAYTNALGRLTDDASPLPFDEIRQVVEEELGGRIAVLFRSFDNVPLGSASLAQVHRAVLADGRPVAVKVQRPGVRSQVLDDMDVVAELAAMFDEHVGAARRAGLGAMVEEFRRAVVEELDYHQEATQLAVFEEITGSYDRLVVPAPVLERTTARVLTMTLIEGRPVSALVPGDLASGVAETMCDQLLRAYLDQLLVHGIFHADPHPGNVLVTPEDTLALVDMGMVGRLSPQRRETLLRLLVALSEGQGEAVADALERLGERLEDYDPDRLRREVAALVVSISGHAVKDLAAGSQLAVLARIAATCGLRPAPELSMVGKTLLHIEDVVRHLAPHMDPSEAVRAHTDSLLRRHLLDAASTTRMVTTALEAKEFVERLPQRMNRVLDTLAAGRFRVGVDGMDEAEIMLSVQKLANRAAAGLAVAALVLAAAIFSISSRGPRLLGESAFSVVLLGLAFLLGVVLVVATVRSDLPQHRRGSRSATGRRRRPSG